MSSTNRREKLKKSGEKNDSSSVKSKSKISQGSRLEKHLIGVSSLIAHQNTIIGLGFTKKGLLLTASLDHNKKVQTYLINLFFQLFDFKGITIKKSPISSIRLRSQILSLAIAENSSIHAISDKDRGVKLFQGANKNPTIQHKYHQGFVRSMIFHSALTLISGGDDKKIVAFDTNKKKCILEKTVASRILKLEGNLNSNYLISGLSNNKIVVTTLSSFKTVDIISLYDGEIKNISWMNDTKILACGVSEETRNGFVKIFDLRKTNLVYEAKEFEGVAIEGVKAINEEHLVAYSHRLHVFFFLIF